MRLRIIRVVTVVRTRTVRLGSVMRFRVVLVFLRIVMGLNLMSFTVQRGFRWTQLYYIRCHRKDHYVLIKSVFV